MNARTKRVGAVLGAGVVMWSSSALAHEGHGDPTWYGTLAHYTLEPEHLAGVLAVVVLALFWARRRSRSRS